MGSSIDETHNETHDGNITSCIEERKFNTSHVLMKINPL